VLHIQRSWPSHYKTIASIIVVKRSTTVPAVRGPVMLQCVHAPSVLYLSGAGSRCLHTGFSGLWILVAGSAMAYGFPREASLDAMVELDVRNVSLCIAAPLLGNCALCSCWGALLLSCSSSISFLLCPVQGTVDGDGHPCTRNIWGVLLALV
jgi:hypothetical protein